MHFLDPASDQIIMTSQLLPASDESDPIELSPGSTSDYISLQTAENSVGCLDLEELLGGSPTNNDPKKMGGIGICLQRIAGRLITKAIAEGSPAEYMLSPGDEILKIDGASAADLSLSDALRLLRGRIGTSVTLQVRRAADGDPSTVTVRRARSRSLRGAPAEASPPHRDSGSRDSGEAAH